MNCGISTVVSRATVAFCIENQQNELFFKGNPEVLLVSSSNCNRSNSSSCRINTSCVKNVFFFLNISLKLPTLLYTVSKFTARHLFGDTYSKLLSTQTTKKVFYHLFFRYKWVFSRSVTLLSCASACFQVSGGANRETCVNSLSV